MDAIVVTWREILVGGAIVVGIYITEWLVFMRTSKRRQEKAPAPVVYDKELQQRLASVENELAVLKHALAQLHSEQAQQVVAAHAADEPVLTPYSQAVDLAKQGFDAATLALQCGISRGEAELIVALYRFNSV